MQGTPGTDQTQGGWLPSAVIAGCAAFWGLYWIPLRETEALGVPLSEGAVARLDFELPAEASPSAASGDVIPPAGSAAPRASSARARASSSE